MHGQSRSPVRTGRPDTVQREQQRQIETQIIELALATEGRKPQTKHYPPDVLQEIRDDFLQIQVVDRKLVTAVTAGIDSDFKLVTKLTGEINKRSRRLKGNLALPRPPASQPEPVAKTAEGSFERLRSSLGVLSNLIESFVSNPMFEHSKVLDQALSDKASRDLLAIIQLSGDIKRSSERLRK
jgi:hypothetical protein